MISAPISPFDVTLSLDHTPCSIYSENMQPLPLQPEDGHANRMVAAADRSSARRGRNCNSPEWWR
jgi:hypothetical protein